MQQFTQFVINHWALWSALILLLVLLLRLELNAQVGGMRLVSPQEATNLINRENAIALDLRDAKAFNLGHIAESLHIPSAELESKLAMLQKYKSQPLVVSTANGQVSPKIGTTLRQQGFEKLYLIKGGIQAWQAANIPLVTGK